MSTSKKSADAAIRLASGVTVHTSISYTTHQKKTVKPKMKEDEEDLVVKINSGLTLQVNKGERLWPKDGAKVDKEVGLRIDWGETYQDAVTGLWFKNLQIQPNSDAIAEALKKAAGRNSHMKLATIKIPTTLKVTYEDLEAAMDQISRGKDN